MTDVPVAVVVAVAAEVVVMANVVAETEEKEEETEKVVVVVVVAVVVPSEPFSLNMNVVTAYYPHLCFQDVVEIILLTSLKQITP